MDNLKATYMYPMIMFNLSFCDFLFGEYEYLNNVTADQNGSLQIKLSNDTGEKN